MSAKITSLPFCIPLMVGLQTDQYSAFCWKQLLRVCSFSVQRSASAKHTSLFYVRLTYSKRLSHMRNTYLRTGLLYCLHLDHFWNVILPLPATSLLNWGGDFVEGRLCWGRLCQGATLSGGEFVRGEFVKGRLCCPRGRLCRGATL